MPQKSKLTTSKRRSNDLRQRVSRWTKGDRKVSTSLLFTAIVELWSKAEPSDAALALFELSDLARRAAQRQTTVTQIRALELQLAQATTDKEREGTLLALERLRTTTPSAEAKRVHTLAQRHHLGALIAQRGNAQTHEERQQIDANIVRLDAEVGSQSDDAPE